MAPAIRIATIGDIDQNAAKFSLSDRQVPIRVQLAPLSDEATRELARELLQGVEGVPEDAVRLLVERSEGVPYFAEEVVNWFVDRGIIAPVAENEPLTGNNLASKEAGYVTGQTLHINGGMAMLG